MSIRRIPVWIVVVGVALPRCDAHAQIVADTLSGADIGAKINTADRSLGLRCGSIEISSPGTASTPVSLGTCHALTLIAPVTWLATITLPHGSSGQTITCPAPQTLSFAPTGAWITATDVSNVAVESCAVVGSSGRGGLYLMASINAGSNIVITHNRLTNADLLVTGSSAPLSPCAANSTCPYPNVTAANSSNNVVVENNTVHNENYTGTAVTLAFTNQASIAKNQFEGVETGVEWWGGDSCVGNGCTAGGNGSMTNARKMTHLKVSNNTITAKNSCVWGSMGQFIDVAGNTCTGIDSGDVGLDAEGSFDVVFEHNSIKGFKNGDFATFWLCTRVSFDSNDASQDDAGMPLFELQNATQSAAGLTVSFTNNHFSCLDKKNACSTRGAALETITVNQNHFLNTRLELDANNQNHIQIEGNDFRFSVPAPSAIAVHGYNRSAGIANNGLLEIANNAITSNASQPDAAQAILAVGDDFNAPQ